MRCIKAITLVGLNCLNGKALTCSTVRRQIILAALPYWITPFDSFCAGTGCWSPVLPYGAKGLLHFAHALCISH